jgi:hypothetical protein
MHGFMPVKAGRPRPSRTTGLSQRGASRLSRALAAAAQTCNDRLGRGNRALQKEYEKIQAKAGANRAYNAAENEVNRVCHAHSPVIILTSLTAHCGGLLSSKTGVVLY